MHALLNDGHRELATTDGPVRIFVFMHEDEHIIRCHGGIFFELAGNIGIKCPFHRAAAATTHGDFDKHHAVRARDAVEGSAVEKLLRIVIAHEIEQLIGRHADTVAQCLVNAVDDGQALGGGRLLVHTGRLDLATLNATDREAFVAALGPTFEHSPWVAEGAWAAGPFASIKNLHAAALDVVRRALRAMQPALCRPTKAQIFGELRLRTERASQSEFAEAPAQIGYITRLRVRSLPGAHRTAG